MYWLLQQIGLELFSLICDADKIIIYFFLSNHLALRKPQALNNSNKHNQQYVGKNSIGIALNHRQNECLYLVGSNTHHSVIKLRNLASESERY